MFTGTRGVAVALFGVGTLYLRAKRRLEAEYSQVHGTSDLGAGVEERYVRDCRRIPGIGCLTGWRKTNQLN